MRFSANGIALLKKFEGIRLKTYLDSAGKATIGVGHLLKPGESFPNGITESEAEDLLLADIIPVENAVNALVKVSLSQSQFDALVSWAFNEGSGRLASSTLLVKLTAATIPRCP